MAVKDGYNFKIFDTYRPRVVEEYITKNYLELYNKNSNVKKWVNYDKEGNYWGPGWFMTTTGTSKHCQGIAIDLGITDKNGKDLKAQTEYDVLDTHALRKYNNKNANLLSKYMTNAEFSTLSSEWWHFDERQNKNVNYNQYETFYIYD